MKNVALILALGALTMLGSCRGNLEYASETRTPENSAGVPAAYALTNKNALSPTGGTVTAKTTATRSHSNIVSQRVVLAQAVGAGNIEPFTWHAADTSAAVPAGL